MNFFCFEEEFFGKPGLRVGFFLFKNMQQLLTSRTAVAVGRVGIFVFVRKRFFLESHQCTIFILFEE